MRYEQYKAKFSNIKQKIYFSENDYGIIILQSLKKYVFNKL